MSAQNCTTVANFAPAIYHVSCLREGYTYTDSIEFLNSDGEAFPSAGIMADDFSLIVKDSAGDIVTTLTVGSGLSIDSASLLTIFWGTIITGTADTYTYDLIWSITSTGEEAPVLMGNITVVEEGTNCGSRACATGSTIRVRMGSNATLTVNRSGGGYTSPQIQTIEDGDTVVVPAGKFMMVGIDPEAGARTVSVGTTAGGTQIYDTVIIGSGQSGTLGPLMYFGTATTIHFSGDTIEARILLL